MAFVKVAGVADIEPGSGRVVEAGYRELALFNVNGEFFCIDNTCPHAEGPLGEGELNDEVVTCPWHAWEFNVKTGEGLYGTGVCATRFRCKVEGDDVLVDI